MRLLSVVANRGGKKRKKKRMEKRVGERGNAKKRKEEKGWGRVIERCG